MQSRLLLLVAFLISVVVGCDDPEVQDKVADILEHGAVSAELECFVTKPFAKPVVTVTRNVVKYTAQKFIDGSCYTNICVGTNYVASHNSPSNEQCWAHLYARSSINAETCSVLAPISLIDTHPSYPFRIGVDGAHVYVEDGFLKGEFIENEFNDNSPNCGGGPGPCHETEPWFTHNVEASGCTGRNLEAFGTTP